jgi:hypothetical protein
VLPQREIRLDTIFDRGQAQFLDAGDLILSERLIGKVRQRIAAKQTKRGSEPVPRKRPITSIERPSTLGDQLLEARNVDTIGLDGQQVAPSLGDDRIRGQQFPQIGDVPLQRLDRGRGCLIPPQLVDQPVRRERLIAVNQQQREQRALLCAA